MEPVVRDYFNKIMRIFLLYHGKVIMGNCWVIVEHFVAALESIPFR